MPFVICMDYKGNQSCIVLNSMSTQQLMTWPGIILFKCYFQFKSTCQITLDRPRMTMAYCSQRVVRGPWRRKGRCGSRWHLGTTSCSTWIGRRQGRPPTKMLVFWVSPGTVKTWHRPGRRAGKIWICSSCGLLNLACINLQDSIVPYSDILVAWNRIWWEYLHQGNRQSLMAR